MNTDPPACACPHALPQWARVAEQAAWWALMAAILALPLAPGLSQGATGAALVLLAPSLALAPGHWLRSPWLWLAALWLGWHLGASLWHADPLPLLSPVLLGGLMWWLVQGQPRRWRLAHAALLITLALAVTLAAIQFVVGVATQQPPWFISTEGQRGRLAVGFFGQSWVFSQVCALGLLWALLGLGRERRLWVNGLVVVGVLIAATGVALSTTRSTGLALMPALALWAVLRMPHWRWRAIAVTLALGLAALTWMVIVHFHPLSPAQ